MRRDLLQSRETAHKIFSRARIGGPKEAVNQYGHSFYFYFYILKLPVRNKPMPERTLSNELLYEVA